MIEKKCDECDEKGFQEYEGKFRCEKHHTEAKRKANIEFEKKRETQKDRDNYWCYSGSDNRFCHNLSIRCKFVKK